MALRVLCGYQWDRFRSPISRNHSVTDSLLEQEPSSGVRSPLLPWWRTLKDEGAVRLVNSTEMTKFENFKEHFYKRRTKGKSVLKMGSFLDKAETVESHHLSQPPTRQVHAVSRTAVIRPLA